MQLNNAMLAEKGEVFRALHRRDRAFIIPNPWDVGTARLLELLGFEALATTSAGFAYSIGKPDGSVILVAQTREEAEARAKNWADKPRTPSPGVK